MTNTQKAGTNRPFAAISRGLLAGAQHSAEEKLEVGYWDSNPILRRRRSRFSLRRKRLKRSVNAIAIEP